MIPMPDPEPLPPLPCEGGSYELINGQWQLMQQTSPATVADPIITPEED
jgi:hypothetical protein